MREHTETHCTVHMSVYSVSTPHNVLMVFFLISCRTCTFSLLRIRVCVFVVYFGTFNKFPQNSVHLYMEMMFNFILLRLVYRQHIHVYSIVLSFVLCTTHSRDLIDPWLITHISGSTLWGNTILQRSLSYCHEVDVLW